MVFVTEGFPLGVNGHHGQHGGVESVDAFVRSAGGMGFASFVANELADEAVAGAAYLDKAASFAGCGEMHHHGHVNIVKSAEAD